MRGWLVIALVAVAAVAVAVTAAVVAAVREQREQEARLAAIEAAEEFVAAWQAGDWDRLDALVVDSAVGAGSAHARTVEALGVAGSEVTLTDITFADPVGDGATADYTAAFTLAGLGEWTYDGSFRLAAAEGEWTVVWAPDTLHPQLAAGQRLARDRSWPTRAPLLDRHGADVTAGPFGALAGSLGEASEEQAAALGPTYVAGDVVGQSGLQAALEGRLAGAPGGVVQIVDSEGDAVSTLVDFALTEPEPVRTTLDPVIQAAGVSALDPISNPSALVAVDVPSGEVRAVVSAPAGGFDRALSGRYPPGSTFKVVTTAALLANGLDPGATVPCPATISIGGRSFRNAGFAAFGPITFREAFAQSCNTAFVSQAGGLPEGALRAAAEQFGFGVGYDIGIPVADSRFPDPVDAVEHAAAAIGQGRVEATPLHMASVAAAVGRGGWVAPTILAADGGAAADDGPERLPQPLPAQMADLMRHAVAAGTGTAAALPGPPVAGKTGTAEFGSARTHAWFIAFRGDLAVAVLVEGGGFGGTVAAPAAARFYAALG